MDLNCCNNKTFNSYRQQYVVTMLSTTFYNNDPREEERDLTQSYLKKKKPLRRQKTPKSKITTKNDTKIFDSTMIKDRLKTVSWSNDSHPTGVVKPVYGIPLTAKAV